MMDWRANLRAIGDQLIDGVFPIVTIGGTVLPGRTSNEFNKLGKGQRNGTQRERTRKWQRHEPRSWSASGATSVKRGNFAEYYEADVAQVRAAYPDVKITNDSQGMWIEFESSLIRGYSGKVTFLVACIFKPNPIVRGWAFWKSAISARWIGPRHTNYTDGSICAFFPSDGSWVLGDSLVQLFDLYVVWALRHLYLIEFSKWPGHQHSAFAFERIREYHDDEMCGCDRPIGTYRVCCKSSDLSAILHPTEADQWFALQWAARQPPKMILDHVMGNSSSLSLAALSKAA